MSPELIEFGKYIAGIAIIAYINVQVVRSEISSIKDTIKILDQRLWDVKLSKGQSNEKNSLAA